MPNMWENPPRKIGKLTITPTGARIYRCTLCRPVEWFSGPNGKELYEQHATCVHGATPTELVG